MRLKEQVKTLPKSKLVPYFVETLYQCYNPGLELTELKTQINDIAGENCELKRMVKKLSKGTTSRGVTSDSNKALEAEVSTLKGVISDLKSQNESLLKHILEQECVIAHDDVTPNVHQDSVIIDMKNEISKLNRNHDFLISEKRHFLL